jgi:hypothetical protein
VVGIFEKGNVGMNNLRRLGNQFSIQIRPDKEGYVGRECPVEKCLGYFKITLGTGVKGPAPCHCPYCGHSGESNTFFTQEQIEYAKSVAIRQVTDAFFQVRQKKSWVDSGSGSFPSE